MTFNGLLAKLLEYDIKLRRDGDGLLIQYDGELTDSELFAGLREHKAALIALLGDDPDWWQPEAVITPQMLTLVALSEDEIARIVQRIAGGARNVQDIYPLAPLQQGMLFHHLMASEGDPYLLDTLFAFDSRALLDRFAGALQQVIARHDILRTSVHWEELGEPVQVVLREAPLPIEEIGLDPADGDIGAQLESRFDARRIRLDLTQAPLLRAIVAYDAPNQRWMMHVLFHHVVMDHTALAGVEREVQSILAGRLDELPEPVPFRNYVAQARLGISREEHEAFFRDMLAGIDEPTLPFGLHDVQGDGQGIVETHAPLEAPLAKRLREQARRLGVSAASLFHLAWGLVVGHTAGRREVVFGTVLFGRMQGGANAAHALGMFINTLPLRIDLGDSPRDAVARTHALLTQLLRHEHAPLALAQQCSGVATSTPLFSSLLNYRHGGGHAEQAGALSGVESVQSQERTNYPLSLAVDDMGEGFALTAQVIDGVQGAVVCAYMQTALQGLVSALENDTRAPLGALPILTGGEREAQLYEWNQTRRAYPDQDCLPALFEAQVARTPDAIALTHAGQSLSYAELNQRANRLAHHLIALGIGPDRRVALCAARGIEMVVGLLGVLKAGGAYVPLDPAYPSERLNHILEDAEPHLVLADAAGFATLGGDAAVPAALRLDAPSWRDAATTNPAPGPLQPGHLAYVIYTSGSTGKPKGVQVGHGALVNLLWSMADRPGISAGDSVLNLTSLSFDIAGLELYLPLLHGARLVLAPQGAGLDPSLLASVIESEAVTFVQATPAHWRALLEHGWPQATFTLLCGGEALPAAFAARLFEQVPVIWNMYGPTETTIWSALHRMTPGDAPSVGLPIANTALYVLDANLEPVPQGVAGDLYIAGAGLARGYAGRPSLTAEAFLPNPFGAAGERMYRSGDSVRRRDDGTFEFIGRTDQQIKIRGLRIEPAEVEAVIAAHPQVRHAVVSARADAAGQAHLVAYVEPIESRADDNGLSFSLFYFGAETYDPADKYRLYIESARFADQHGFEAVWTPERHFHTVGALYPNSAVLNSALAACTERVHLRAGSVVLPLHSVQRVAEEWAVVDNLSGGRVGVAIASGWHSRDFSLAPENYAPARRKDAVREGIEQLKALWAGEAVSFPDGLGQPVDIRVFPRPVQAALPIWLTAAGNPDTFVHAGRIGAHVLTHLLGQSLDELAERIALYRQALVDHGHDPRRQRVTLMVHAYVGDELDSTVEAARVPFMNYMREHIGLLRPMVQSLVPEEFSAPADIDRFIEQHIDQLVEFAFERYARQAALIGTPASCRPLLERFKECGVDEIACLIDWMEPDLALQALPALDQLRQMAQGSVLGARALRQHCQERLPDYMVPGQMVFMHQWPLTPNGKVDRKALPAPDLTGLGQQGYEAPQNETEQRIAEIWQDVLGQPRVGRHDNFFELGGHSLLAINVIERMRKAGLHTDVRALFTAGTLVALAAQAGGETSAIVVPASAIVAGNATVTPQMLPLVSLTQAQIDTLVASVPGGAANVQDIYPLAPLQEGVLFHHLMSREGDPFLLSALFGIDTRVRLDAFLGSLQQVIARHDILRTSVHWEGLAEPVQVVRREATLRVDEVQLEPQGDAPATQLRALFDERRLRLDVREAPLLRVVVAQNSGSDRWLMLVLFHHLAMDHTALEQVAQEVQMVVAGEAARLLPSVPFRNYVTQARLGVSRDEHMTFFREMLADIDEPTLPYGLQDVQGEGRGIGETRLSVNAELARRVRSQARQHGVSAASLFHLAWAQVLGQACGRDDVVFGTVLFGRMAGGEGAERALGMFINTLPVRIRLAGSVKASVAETHRSLTDLLRHEHAPLALAQHCSHVAASAPLFSALLNYRYSAPATQRDGIELLEAEERTNYPLSLTVDDFGDAFSLTVQVVERLDSARICGHMHEALAQLAQALEQQPQRRVAGLPILPAAEREQILHGWNDTAAPVPEHSLQALFEAQVLRTPDAVALLFEDQMFESHSLTYAQLNRRANRLAHRLIGMGVGRDDRVALCLERSAEMVVGLLGVLKAGAGYVPLDPGYPTARLAYMLGDSAPKVLLTQQRFSAMLDTRVPILDLERDPLADDDSDPRVEVGRAQLAYVIYTSGSTGQPKGVMIDQAGIVNRLHWMQQVYGLQPGESVLQKTPFGFDVSVWEFFWPLLNGARLVLARPQGHKDPEYLAGLIERHGIGTLHFVPSMLQAFVTFLETQPTPRCTCLSRVICSGEALPGPLAQRARACLSDARLHNLYGPTEASVDVSAWACDALVLPDNIPIGLPIANTRLHVLDAAGEPVALGVQGELYIGGIGLARGYLNRAALTAERFVPDPYGAPGSRLYRTGDVVRYRLDGNVEYLGRNDEQVKLRGFRIELGEIAAQLNALEGIGEAQVLAVDDAQGDKRLVAYYTGRVQDAQQVRERLLQRLPDYMVPSAYMWLAQWPLTPNGKLDRRGLPQPDRDAFASQAYEAPVGDAERRIASIWQTVLGQPQVGRQDNFFELGGHSLVAIRVIELMRQAGLHTDVRALFEAPTLAALAATLGEQTSPVRVPANLIDPDAAAITPQMLPLVQLSQEDIERIVATVPGGAANVQDIYPLAPLQEGVLFHHVLAQDGDPYLMDTLFSIETRTRLEAFLLALRQVIGRHDILRTAVHWEGLAEPVQVVWREAHLRVDEVTLAEGEPAERLRAQFGSRNARLDVHAAPLLRVVIARDSGDDRWLMLVLFHHLAIDHMALDSVAREMHALLEGQTDLPAPMPFRDYVAQARLGVSRAEHETFFGHMLGDLDEPTLPFGLHDVQGEGLGIHESRRELDPQLATQIRRQARERGVSPASLFHLAWAQVLGRASGRDDVVFGTVLFGRLQGLAGADTALGMFINTLPIRIGLGDNVRQALQRTHGRLTQLLRHEHAPLALAQQCSAVPAGAPLFSAMLNYRYDDSAESADAAWQGVRALHTEERTSYPLTLAVDDRRESHGFGLSVQVVDSHSGEPIAAYLEQVLRQLCMALEHAPHRPVHGLAMLPEAERDDLLLRWNRTASDYPPQACLQTLFEAQVTRTPQAIALEFESQTLTYAQLNAQANQLAHHLIADGVRPEDLIALCVERSPQMVIGLLGVLKAGAAYVPIDPAYPSERLRHVLRDARPARLLVDALGAETLGSAAQAPGVVRLDRPDWLRQSVDNPAPVLDAAHSAYVIYTSGSTGTPKGVVVSHAALVNLLAAMATQPGITAGDVVLNLTSLSFDIAALELYLPLLHGARLLLATREASTDAERLARLIESRGVSMMQATPSHWRLLVDHRWPQTTLRVLCGGEALPQALAERLLEQVPVVWNLYGPTETTIWSALHPVRRGDDVAIGKPIANTALYVLDAHLEPVPYGVPGELYIAGDGLARGYLRRPDLSAERFLPDPAGAPGARMYRTGDLVRRRVDGVIEFIGRTDQQVKIRGFRIEPVEIETVLARHPQVRQSLVKVHRDAAGQSHLIGYVETQADASRISGPLSFSLFYFGADTYHPDDKYRLYLQSAEFADQHGFEALWTPERHFHAMGGLYPNPALLSATLALRTRHVQLRAGSVVLPLHRVQRVAEEWAAVDNLSGGRAGVAIASGWHVRDFSLAPHNYAPEHRKEAVRAGMQQLKTLWAGEAVSFPDGNGEPVDVRVYPRPLQRELPMWVTAAGHPETFEYAGRTGAHLLTHLLGQTLEELTQKVALYRRTLAEHGHDPRIRRVTLMVHTYLGEDLDTALEDARLPFKHYMREHIGLLRPLVQSMMPADMAATSTQQEIDDFLGQHLEQLTDYAFERYARAAALIGTPSSSLPILRQIIDCGVDEVACLIDWIEPDLALASLPRLNQLREMARSIAAGTPLLREFCQRQLPDYMVPSQLIVIDRWPLTPNGKIDRNALPQPTFGGIAKPLYEAPQGEAEARLAEIWRTILGVERVGRFDHFFELGGHSLSAMQLISQIRRQLGIEVELATMFLHPRLHEQAQALAGAAPSTVPDIVAMPRDGALPLSFAQQRLWFLAQLDGGSSAYHTLVALRLHGDLDERVLQRALDRVLARHEGLRTTFAPGDDGEPTQRLLPEECGFALSHSDLRAHPQPRAALDALREVEGNTPFDLARGPLIRGHLVQLAATEQVLLINMHHIVSDGWSIAVLTRDLGIAYERQQQGVTTPLPALPIQYADFAIWQRAWLSGAMLQAQSDHWRDTLRDAPALLDLPLDRARPAHQDFSGDALPVEFDETLTTAIKALSQRHGTTVYMTVLAAWAVVLGKLASQDEVVIGSPVANRTRAEVEGLIGFFTNTLALRIALPEQASFAELLVAVKTRTLDAQAHQDLPFEQVVEIIKPARSLARSPVFQVMFAWQNNLRAQLDLAGLRLEVLEETQRSAKFDLTLELSEASGKIVGLIEYATALFDPETPQRCAGYLRHVLEAMTRDDRQRLGRVSLTDGVQRQRLLGEWNRTQVEYPDATLVQMFEAQARRSPRALAVVSVDSQATSPASLTYGQLDARANQIARVLIARGVGAETRVAICVERGLDMLTGLLGVLKAGAAYVPLDPAYPLQRLAYMLSDCTPAVLLTQAGLSETMRAALPDGGVDTLYLDADHALFDSLPDVPLAIRARPEHLAYVIYTSGSTGMPKGVMITHHGLSNYLHWARQAYGPALVDGAVVSSSLSFDATITSLWTPLLSGGQVTLLGEGDEIAGLEAHVQHSAGLVKITPAHLDALGRRLLAQGRTGRTHTFVIGGEALAASTVALWQGLQPGVRLVNEYGPTETVVGCIVHDAQTLPAGVLNVPIGRPLANTLIYLLDSHGEPVPVGVTGEIHIGGAGVTRGYLNRAALTAERVVPDPFGAPGTRMYRTGDLARYLADGCLEYLGRNDEQVKLRGFRIELGEIEAELRDCSGVRDAAVIVRRDAEGDRRLVAYFTGAASADSDQLRARLQANLPDYMVPAAYVRLDALPLTPNGKLDRRELPEPDRAAYAQRGYEAPVGAVEQPLARLWSQLLGVEQVGRQDNFFELGGHSLLAISLIERLRQQGLYTDVRTLFGAPTLAVLAAALTDRPTQVEVPANGIPTGAVAITPRMLPLVSLTAQEIAAIVARVPGGAANVQDIYPLAPLQEGVLFHHLLDSDRDPYLLSAGFAFDSRAHLDAFVEALRAVIARHDILRTAVYWEGLAEPVQVVWREAPLAVEEIATGAWDGHAASLLDGRLDVRQAPMLRLLASRAGTQGWVMRVLFHHLAMDHTALEVVQQEMGVYLQGAGATLPPPSPFREYVAQARGGVSRERQREFFTQMLGTVDEPTLPFALGDVLGDGRGIDEAYLPVDADLAQRLRRQARHAGVSPASLFHLAFAQVVGRASERADVVFGTVLFGRLQGAANAERALGMFINTLPLRIRLDGGAADALRDTHAALTHLLRHEHASLALAQQCSGVAAPAPLFSALLNYRYAASLPDHQRDTPAWQGITALAAEERTSYPLVMAVDDRAEGFGLSVQVLDHLSASRICGYMHTALASLAEALERTPARRVSELPILPHAEREQLLRDWSQGTPHPRPGPSLHGLFEAQVARTPDAVALISAQGELTYRQLNQQANALARHLIDAGAVADSRVAICVERSPMMVVGMLGVLKAGACYVPLDPGYPAERLAYMLADSQPLALLRHAATAAIVAGLSSRTDAWVAIDLDALDLDGAYRPDLESATRAEQLAYVMYTSGSTGLPKGVGVEHCQVVNHMHWMQDAFALGPTDAVVQKTPFSFDASVWEFYAPLLAGARLVLAAPDGHRDVAYLGALLRSQSIHTLQAVPTLLAALLEANALADCPALRRVFCGGEALSQRLVEACQAQAPQVEVINLYGPTEATIDACWYVYPRGVPAPDAVIGRPLSGVSLYVLDSQREPVPIGAVGELYIGGAGVARGYLNRAALTADRFVSDPFGPAGGRLYRSGDLARFLEDGNLQYLGRNDAQVKLRGQRIEPGEIEAHLRSAGVSQPVVLVREDVRGDPGLVAYYTGPAHDPQTLRTGLLQALPEHMVPAAFIALEQLPLTASGKLDRRALPMPQDTAFASRAYVAAATAVERTVAAIWSGVLGVSRVGRHDSFFALGGHSLLATQMIVQVRRAYGIELPLRAVFEAATLAAFAERVAQAGQGTGGQGPALIAGPRPARLPLSFEQQRIWLLDQMLEDKTLYHVPLALQVSGTLDSAALGAALTQIVARHEVLRTRYLFAQGLTQQVIDAPARFVLERIDLSAVNAAAAAQERAVAQHVREYADRPFDLGRGPLLRGLVIKREDTEHVLVLTVHHIAFDGWSAGVLVRELSELYDAAARGRAARLPALTVQYADFALWQQQWLQGDVLSARVDYWLRQLAGAPELLELPTDHPRPARQSLRGASHAFNLSPALTEALRALAQEAQSTLFMVLYAGFNLLLSRYSGQTDICIGTPVANRHQAEVEPLVGFFVNTLVLRTPVEPLESFTGLLRRARDTALEAYAHQEVPFEHLVEVLNPQRDLSHTPLFQAMLVLQNAPAAELSLGDLVTRPYGVDTVTAKYDLLLNVSEGPEGLHCGFEYCADLFEAATLARMGDHLMTVLQAAVAAPHLRVGELPMLAARERQSLLQVGNPTPVVARLDSIQALFHRQVVATPDAVALVTEHVALSYAALDGRANRLAHYLRGRGVGPDVRVGVCIRRSVDMIVALLGILKAGGAYLPLDPDYPRERLDHMLRDARPRLLLCERGLLADLPAGLPVVHADDPAIDACPTTPPQDLTHAQHLAYVLYTSGSTGLPKGVAVTHAGVVRLVHDNDFFDATQGQRVLQFASLSFDAATFEIWAPLLNGGTLVLAAPRRQSLAELAATLVAQWIDVVWLTAALFNQMVERQLPAFARVRHVLTGGEALSLSHVRRFMAAGNGARLTNGYGPTECTTFACCHGISAEGLRGQSVPIGLPINDTAVYILDAFHEPVPLGVAGELYIAGKGLARGYLDRPDLTAERFVPDPFAGDGSRLYRSGDVVRRLEDGSIEYIGRRDEQIKIRGFRIETAEIELALLSIPEVNEAKVIALDVGAGERQLVAYVVTRTEGLDLHGVLRQKLPEYMVPAHFVRLDLLPVTVNGKVDRGALPRPDLSLLHQPSTAPTSPIEVMLAQIWGEVLKRENIAIEDNFFELGGHSLSATQVVSEVKEQLQMDLPLRAFFEYPTIASIAPVLEALIVEHIKGLSEEDAADLLEQGSESEHR